MRVPRHDYSLFLIILQLHSFLFQFFGTRDDHVRKNPEHLLGRIIPRQPHPHHFNSRAPGVWHQRHIVFVMDVRRKNERGRILPYQIRKKTKGRKIKIEPADKPLRQKSAPEKTYEARAHKIKKLPVPVKFISALSARGARIEKSPRKPLEEKAHKCTRGLVELDSFNKNIFTFKIFPEIIKFMLRDDDDHMHILIVFEHHKKIRKQYVSGNMVVETCYKYGLHQLFGV